MSKARLEDTIERINVLFAEMMTLMVEEIGLLKLRTERLEAELAARTEELTDALHQLGAKKMAESSFVEVQFSCGHPVACIESSEEGTCYCGWCVSEDAHAAEVIRSHEQVAEIQRQVRGIECELGLALVTYEGLPAEIEAVRDWAKNVADAAPAGGRVRAACEHGDSSLSEDGDCLVCALERCGDYGEQIRKRLENQA